MPYTEGKLNFQARAPLVVPQNTVDRTALCLVCKVNSF